MTLTAVINPVVPLNLLFTHQRVICPHSRLSAKYRIVTHNFTNDNLTDGNSPSYQFIQMVHDIIHVMTKGKSFWVFWRVHVSTKSHGMTLKFISHLNHNVHETS